MLRTLLLLSLLVRAVAAEHAVPADAADGSVSALVAAAARAASGDRLVLMRGGVYRVPDGLEFHAGVAVGADGPAASPPPLLTTSIIVPVLTPWAKNPKVLTARVDRPVLECYVAGRFLVQARYPNRGWLRAQQGSTPDLLAVADAAVTGAPRWTGAQVRWRRWSWWWETRPITADNGKGQLTLGAEGRYSDPFTGIGSAFCIDNCLSELDAPGEWVWDRATSTLYVYPPEDAAAHAPVEVVLEGKGFQCSGATLDGIAFARIGGTALRIGRASVISGCSFSDIGEDAIGGTFDAAGTRITGCTFHDVRNVAISWIENPAGVGGTVIEGNRFERIGMQFGYGGSGSWHAAGVILHAGKGVVVRGNRFVDIGYAGVLLGSPGQVVERNVLVRCMGSLNDGAAIYANCSECVIRDNIILDCIGNLDTSHPWYPLGHGIWPEFLSDFHDQVITGNTVFGSGGNGLFLTNNYHCRIADNVLIGNRIAGLHLSGKKNVQDNTFTGNLLGAMDPPRRLRLAENIPADWKGNDIARCIDAEEGTQYGHMSGTQLVASPTLALVQVGGRRADDVAAWQQLAPWADAGARVERATILLLINDTMREHAFPTPAGGWALSGGGTLGKTIPVAAFRSAVLVRAGGADGVPPYVLASGEDYRAPAVAKSHAAAARPATTAPRPAAPASPPVARGATLPPAISAAWDQRLRLRVGRSVAAGRPARYRSSAFHAPVTVTGVDGDATLRAVLNGGAISLPWKALAQADLADLACDVAGDDAEGQALAAFHLYAAGRRQEAEDRVAKAGPEGAQVRALFAPTTPAAAAP